MESPILTVVMPIYNRPDSTLRAIGSVLDQDFADLEIVVVDDGSAPPFALPAAFASDRRIVLVRHQTNRGAAAARNTGMARARGRWVAFLDSDDLWLPGSLAPRFAEAQASSPGDRLTVWAAAFMMVDAARGPLEIRYPMASADPIDFASGCWLSAGSTALFLREPVMQRLGGQDETLRRFEDNDWFLRLALAGGEVRVSRVVAAAINVGPRPNREVSDRAATAVIAKLAAANIDAKQRKMLLRQLKAWRDFELAAADWHHGNYTRTAAALAASWLRVPRLRLQLKDFWQRADPETNL